MEAIEIKGIKSESKMQELLRALELCKEVQSILTKNIPAKRDELNDCVEYYDEMSEAVDETFRLMISISNAIGVLTAYDILDKALFTES